MLIAKLAMHYGGCQHSKEWHWCIVVRDGTDTNIPDAWVGILKGLWLNECKLCYQNHKNDKQYLKKKKNQMWCFVFL